MGSCALGVVLAWSAPATAQSVISAFGNFAYPKLGDRMVRVADANGDGIEDFVLAGDPGFSVGPPYATVALVSGSNGTLLQTHSDPQFASGYGASLAAAGDLDHDGFGDFAFGAQSNSSGAVPRVLAFSGKTAAQLFEVQNPFGTAFGGFGRPLAGIGDVNGDGTADLAIGNPFSTAFPLTVVSGVDGSTIYALINEHIGVGLAAVGDVDQDGAVDYAMQVDATLDSIAIHSGATGALLRSLSSHFSGADFGKSITYAGDIDNDGIPDLAASDLLSVGLTAGLGGIYVYAGATGAEISQVRNPFYGSFYGGGFGLCLAGGEDVSGDAQPDLVIGTPLSLLPVMVADAATGRWLAALPTALNLVQGRAVAIVADRSGDGVADVADSAGTIAFAAVSSLRIRAIDKTSVESVGTICPGSGGFTPVLQGTLTPAGANDSISIQLTQGLGGAPCVLLASLPGIVQTSTSCGFLFISPWISPLTIVTTLGGTGPGQGTLAAGGNVLAGFGAITIQAVVADPGALKSLALSNALVMKG